MTEKKLYKPEMKPFPIQAKSGEIYQVKVGHITCDPADRYGWKKDRLIVWMEFSPSIQGTMATGGELPIKEYSQSELIEAITKLAQETVEKCIADNKQRRQDEDIEERHKKAIKEAQNELDAYTEKVGRILDGK